MLNRYIFIFMLIAVLSISYAFSAEPDYTIDNNFGFEYWTGREGSVKKSIELPVAPFLEYGIEYTPTSGPPTLLYLHLPLSKDDTGKQGLIYIQIFSSVEDAQKYLLDSLYGITSPDKPPHLTSEAFSPGDVAFGKEYSYPDPNAISPARYYVFFSRANVFVRITAPQDVAKELANKIDSVIQESPDWSLGDASPNLIISEEFARTFLAGSSAIDEGATAETPHAFTLHRNAPNPFNPGTAIGYELTQPGQVSLRIYDLLGREVAVPVEGMKDAGHHEAYWNGRDLTGNPAASGVYLYRLETGGSAETRRMMLVR